MKRIGLLTVLLLFIISTVNADNNWKMRFALNGIFYENSSNRFITEFNTYTAEVGVMYKNKLLLGVGSGYSEGFKMGDPYGRTVKYVPLYADLKYYVQALKWMEFFGGLEMGCEFRKLTKSQDKFNHSRDNHFLCYPQAGLYVKIYKRLGVEVSFGYRSGMCDFWRPNFSIVF